MVRGQGPIALKDNLFRTTTPCGRELCLPLRKAHTMLRAHGKICNVCKASGVPLDESSMAKLPVTNCRDRMVCRRSTHLEQLAPLKDLLIDTNSMPATSERSHGNG